MTEDVFLLFEDTKKSHRGFSFSNPIRRLQANRLEDVKSCLQEATKYQKQGNYVAGYIAYEAGWVLLKKQSRQPKLPAYPLVDLYVFKDKNIFNSMKDDQEHAFLYDFQTKTSFEKYSGDLEKIFEHLKLGDTYQVNYTQRTTFESTTDPWATYQVLRKVQRVEYAAFLGLKDLHILSFSPELFLKKTGNVLKTKPMKGTKARDTNADQDRQNKEFLASDEKNRAENVMIVDLLRNDMGKIAKPGTVNVTSLFQIEEYETVFQMTSEIECELDEKMEFHDIFAALFPCGSITGAPKQRTMEIIDELESEPRGVYTGAIGFLEPNGDFCFSVAIRTLVKTQEPKYTFGTGGGVLVDSNIEEEHKEAALKGRFLSATNGSFSLFETFLYDGTQFKNLDDHLARLEKSAAFFAFLFPRQEIERRLQTLSGGTACRVKIILWNDGRAEIETHNLEALPENPEVLVSTSRIDSGHIFQQHKTSRRNLYDDQYKTARLVDFYDVLYLNEKEHVVEASRHNIFVKIDGEWFTPPLTSGALPGIERAHAIKDLPARQRVLKLKDVKSAEEVMLTNSLRGRVIVKLRDAL